MSESPYMPPEEISTSATASVREGAIVKQWLVFVVLSTILGFVAGAVAGGIVGAFLGAARASLETIRLAGSVAGAIAGLPVSYFCFRMSVKNLLAVRHDS